MPKIYGKTYNTTRDDLANKIRNELKDEDCSTVAKLCFDFWKDKYGHFEHFIKLLQNIGSSPTKPTTPCSSLSALAGESLRMNVGLERGIKTSSTERERIGEAVTEMKAGDRTVWDLLLRALEASNQPGRSRSEVYYLTKGRVSGIRGFAIPVSLRRCSRPNSYVMLSKDEPPYHCEIAPSSLTIVSWQSSPKRMPSLHSSFRRLWRTK
nr:RNA polymerase, mitochondrial [Tanacetum cinerariifolium]